MIDPELVALVAALPTVHGWTVHHEGFMGVIYWTHPATDVTVYATPEFHDDATVSIEFQTSEGYVYDALIVPCVDWRNPIAYAGLMAPHLKHALVCAGCGASEPQGNTCCP